VGFIVNSSALIAAERRRITYQQVLPSASEPVAIAAITASELLHGLQRSPPAHRQAREPILEQLLSAWPIIAFDLDTARIHASLAAQLSAAGTPVGAHDLIIAATAVQLNYHVLTRDQRSFPRVPGLRVRLLS
jgi:predicted nucleic acid-binding protein